MFAPKLFEQPHHGPVKDADDGLQHAQQTRCAERPAIPQQGVVLLLDANAGDAAKHVEMVGQFLELNQLDLPGPMLLFDDGLQGNRGVAMPAAGIVENDVDLLFASFGGVCHRHSQIVARNWAAL